MVDGLSRREVLAAGAVVGAGLLGMRAAAAAAAAPKAEIVSVDVISKQADIYCGWPTLARRSDGELLLVWSGGREAHVCPFGRVDFMRSRDGGKTWTWPQTLIDGPTDDRDAGVLETEKGTLLATTFTSLAYEPILAAAEAKKTGDAGAWTADKLSRWQGARDRIDAARRKAELGTWMIRSEDGGVHWSAPYRVPANSPHGPVRLAGGRLLYAGKSLWTGDQRVGVCDSTDDGKTWNWLADIPARTGDDPKAYHELHAVETADNRIVVHIRNHNKPNAGETLQSESADGGKTWTQPKSIGVWGLPSHLLRLKDGRLLMSYGHRRAPLGNQARVSADHGRTWSEPMMLSTDGVTGDLGYPSTVELDDGSLVTVWYEVVKGRKLAALRQARWKIV